LLNRFGVFFEQMKNNWEWLGEVKVQAESKGAEELCTEINYVELRC